MGCCGEENNCNFEHWPKIGTFCPGNDMLVDLPEIQGELGYDPRLTKIFLIIISEPADCMNLSGNRPGSFVLLCPHCNPEILVDNQSSGTNLQKSLDICNPRSCQLGFRNIWAWVMNTTMQCWMCDDASCNFLSSGIIQDFVMLPGPFSAVHCQRM